MTEEIDPKEPQIIRQELEGFPENDDTGGNSELSFLDMKKWIEENEFLDIYEDIVFVPVLYSEFADQSVWGLRKETQDEIDKRLKIRQYITEDIEKRDRKIYEELKKKFEKEN